MSATLLDTFTATSGQGSSIRELMALEARTATRIELRSADDEGYCPAAPLDLFLDVSADGVTWTELVAFDELVDSRFVSFAEADWSPGQHARFRWVMGDGVRHVWRRVVCWLGAEPEFVFGP